MSQLGKIKAFSLNASAKKVLNKKDLEKQKKIADEEAAAKAYQEFVTAFEETPKTGKLFVRGNVINSASGEEISATNSGKFYKPNKLQEIESKKSFETKPSTSSVSKYEKPAKKKSVKESEKVDFFGDNNKLELLFLELDKQLFEGMLTKNVQVCWAKHLDSTRIRMIKDRGLTYQIRISENNFANTSLSQFIVTLANAMGKVYIEHLNKKRVSKSLDKSGIKPLDETDYSEIRDYLPRLKFPVQYRMSPQVRKIEKMSLADGRLETLDPYPDIQVLFKEYDERYFNGFLSFNEVEVYWSSKMLKCTGICYPATSDRPISIALCRKILQSLPRRFLVESLLHEMIHAWVFARGIGDSDRKSHCPLWEKKANEISQKSGIVIQRFHEAPPLDTCLYTKETIARRLRKFKDAKVKIAEMLKIEQDDKVEKEKDVEEELRKTSINEE